MKIDRPKFITASSMDDALSVARCDVVEVKIDGQWCRAEISQDSARLFSRSGRLIDVWDLDWGQSSATLIGELDQDGVLVVFDAIELWGRSAVDRTLEARRSIARKIVDLIDPVDHEIVMMEQHPASAAPDLWSDLVVSGGAEGLVFKDSRSPYGAPWVKMKRRCEVDFVCMGFTPGFGRRRDRAVGSIEAGLYVGGELMEIQSIGGMRDDEAEDMHEDPDRYIGRAFQAHGLEVNPITGCLINASFDRWRFDKPPAECVSDHTPR